MNTNLNFFFLFKKDYFKVKGSFSNYRLIHLGTFPYQPLYIYMETNTNRKLFQIGWFQTAICWFCWGMTVQENWLHIETVKHTYTLYNTIYWGITIITTKWWYKTPKSQKVTSSWSHYSVCYFSEIIAGLYFRVLPVQIRFSFTDVAKHLLCGPVLKRLTDIYSGNYVLSSSWLCLPLCCVFIICFPSCSTIWVCICIYACVCVGACVCACVGVGACVGVCMDGCMSQEQFESSHVTIKQL